MNIVLGLISLVLLSYHMVSHSLNILCCLITLCSSHMLHMELKFDYLQNWCI